MLKHNTQLCCGSVENDLSCHLSTNDSMLRYKRINSQFLTGTFLLMVMQLLPVVISVHKYLPVKLN